jgi:predicted unusual protein kinase regulating ubiquinone biosynthesis (AarF/ABC1/UbiB family)
VLALQAALLTCIMIFSLKVLVCTGTAVCTVTGVFNGDPHAGNILLLPDGRLGLIDYGQVKYLTENERLHLCKVMLCMVCSASVVNTLLY